MSTLKDLENEIVFFTFVSPTPPCKGHKSQINDKYYKLLSEAGINVVAGHNELMNSKTEKYVFKAMDLCQKYHMHYLVYDELFGEFTAVRTDGKRRYKPYRLLSKEEKDDLIDRYKKSLAKYMNHPACIGILFSDEQGINNFNVLGEAEKIFSELYPDKIFYHNLLSYAASDRDMLYSGAINECDYEKIEFPPLTVENKIKRFDLMMKIFIKTVHPKIISTDLYAMHSIGNVLTSIHNVQYEMGSYMSQMKKKYGLPFWDFIQNGQWESNGRGITLAEYFLQINVKLAYGSSGIELFPGCVPFEYRVMHKKEGLFDFNGNVTDFYYFQKMIIRQVRACQKYLINSEFLGILTYGKYIGLLPKEEELNKIQWNDAIYRGNLPKDTLLEKDDIIRNVTATSQCIIGCFLHNNSKVYYFVNNSIVTVANYRIYFYKNTNILIIRDGEEIYKNDIEFYDVNILNAGESVLILIMNQ